LKVYSLDWLLSSIEDILRNPILDCCRTVIDVTILRTSIARIRGCCLRLLQLGIPETLVHSNISELQIGKTNRSTTYQLYQWHEARITHPFCDFAVMHRGAPCEERAFESVNAAYFAFCSQYGSTEVLKRAVEWARVCHWCINLHIHLCLYELVEPVNKSCVVKDLSRDLRKLSRALRQASTTEYDAKKRKRTE